MSAESFDPAPAARRLARFWSGWEQLDVLPAGERPQNLDDGYRLQRRLMTELGEPVAGYKLGLSSVSAMARSGLGSPILGFVPISRFHQSGDTLAMPFDGGLVIEAEIGFVLADDPLAEPTARLIFEIVRSRFLTPNDVDLPSFVGDASGFCSMVVGDAFPIAEIPALLRSGPVLKHDDRIVGDALKGGECPDPVDVLRRFRLLAARHDMPVEAGMVVTTGSVVAPYHTTAPGLYAAQVGGHQANFVGINQR